MCCNVKIQLSANLLAIFIYQAITCNAKCAYD